MNVFDLEYGQNLLSYVYVLGRQWKNKSGLSAIFRLLSVACQWVGEGELQVIRCQWCERAVTAVSFRSNRLIQRLRHYRFKSIIYRSTNFWRLFISCSGQLFLRFPKCLIIVFSNFVERTFLLQNFERKNKLYRGTWTLGCREGRIYLYFSRQNVFH